MRSAYTTQQVRAAEEVAFAQVPEGALMQRAAAGLAAAVLDLLGPAYGRRVRLLVGSGNNGGDALWAGAMLRRRGVAVDAVLLSGQAHAEGLLALRRAGGHAVSSDDAAAHVLSPPDVVVDGMLGIGGYGGLRDHAAEALDTAAADAPGAAVVAVDVPSGVGVDTGALSGRHVDADLTVAFGSLKPCHLIDPAAEAAGVVHLVDIGLALPAPAVTALQPADVAALLPRPAGPDHKYTRGVVGVRAGSAQYPGAGVLCVAGAAAGLAGMVRYVGDDAVADRVRQAHPEVVGAGRVQAWTVGSGTGDHAAAAVEAALGDGVPVCVDADALAEVRPGGGVPLVLTPHSGELAGMTGVGRPAIEAEPLVHARAAAEFFGATVLLKGRRTLVANPDGAVRVNTTGAPWLATAGAGDVLAGLVGALLAAGLDPFDAASVGAWLHGSAASLAAAGGPLVAGEVAAAIPAAVRALPRPA